MLRLAGCVLLDDQKRLLLLHRNKGGLVQWELPGGKVDEGEDEATTAVRELKEEVGVTVAIERELGSAEFSGGGETCHYTWFLAVQTSRDLPRLCEPQTFDDMRYFSLDELEELQLSANMVNLLQAIKTSSVTL